MATDELTAQRLRELLDYDPETGVSTANVGEQHALLRLEPSEHRHQLVLGR